MSALVAPCARARRRRRDSGSACRQRRSRRADALREPSSETLDRAPEHDDARRHPRHRRARWAISSAPEVVVPTVSLAKPGASGLVASTRILRLQSLTERAMSGVAPYGTGGITTSPCATASAVLPTSAGRPRAAPALRYFSRSGTPNRTGPPEVPAFIDLTVEAFEDPDSGRAATIPRGFGWVRGTSARKPAYGTSRCRRA